MNLVYCDFFDEESIVILPDSGQITYFSLLKIVQVKIPFRLSLCKGFDAPAEIL